MINLKNDGVNINNLIRSNYECIELIETNKKIKPSNFDYIKILNVKYKNNIKKLFLFTIQIVNNINCCQDIYHDFETEKILKLYENYPKTYIDIDSDDEIYNIIVSAV